MSRVRFCTRTVLLCLCAFFLCGCHSQPPVPPIVPQVLSIRAGVQSPLPLKLSDAEWEQTVLDSLEKRIVGRRETLGDIQRIVTEISPLVQEAANLPELQADFAVMAQDNNLSINAMRELWTATQEADLMMESGGKDDAVSPSNACGTAQWLAGSGRANGLHIDAKESQRLTTKINPLKIKTAWYEYLARPDAQPDLSFVPKVSQQEAIAQLPALRSELELLEAKRRRIDERFVPRLAVFAQTHYLVKLYRRFPGLDWLYQAYHGGEGGATRTLKLALGISLFGNTADAIRYGDKGSRLRWETVYRNPYVPHSAQSVRLCVWQRR